jgi:hypothetical protein
MASRLYVVNLTRVASTTALTLIQVVAGASSGLEIVSVKCAQHASTTSTMVPVQLNRKTVAATVTSFTPLLLSAGDSAAKAVGGLAATGITATVEGTDGDIVEQDVFNFLAPWLYLPVPEERISVPPSGIIGLKLPVAVTITVTAQIKFRELE